MIEHVASLYAASISPALICADVAVVEEESCEVENSGQHIKYEYKCDCMNVFDSTCTMVIATCLR